MAPTHQREVPSTSDTAPGPLLEPTAAPLSADRQSGNIAQGALFMLVVAVALIWLPIGGFLIAGVVGGMRAGGTRNALIAALVPIAVLATTVLSLIFTSTLFPATLGWVILAVGGFHFLLLLLGAFIGSTIRAD